jgi:hypothetical protein
MKRKRNWHAAEESSEQPYISVVLSLFDYGFAGEPFGAASKDSRVNHDVASGTPTTPPFWEAEN